MVKKTGKKKPVKRSVFPFYLKPFPDNEGFLLSIGKFLKGLRGRKTVNAVAKEAGFSAQEIKKIEAGNFHLCLGQIRQILYRGYECSLEDVLEGCYKDYSDVLNPSDDRIFQRDWHYRFCFSNESRQDPTPILVGGEPKSFLWAAPFRKLTNQNLVTELLELAPARKYFGFTTKNSHDGTEVIHVIHGTVRFYIKGGGNEGEYNRLLTKGDSIHFNARFAHHVENEKPTHSALLLIVRSLDIRQGKS